MEKEEQKKKKQQQQEMCGPQSLKYLLASPLQKVFG